jgi:uncharacterized protein (TIGR03067 family)
VEISRDCYNERFASVIFVVIPGKRGAVMKHCILGYLVFIGMAGLLLSDRATKADGDKPASGKITDNTEIGKLVGAWTVSSVKRGGREFPRIQGEQERIIFTEDGKVRSGTATSERKGTYRIDAGKTPNQIDLIWQDDQKPRVWKLLYEIEGDKMKWGFSAEWDKEIRPTSFQDDEMIIMRLKRKKS